MRNYFAAIAKREAKAASISNTVKLTEKVHNAVDAGIGAANGRIVDKAKGISKVGNEPAYKYS